MKWGRFVRLIPLYYVTSIPFMFQRKTKEFCQELHMIGKSGIKECFFVDFHSEYFVMKSIKCLSNFISEDYSDKLWNSFSKFREHIQPKKNKVISLKDHSFICLQYCFFLIYHLNDISD